MLDYYAWNNIPCHVQDFETNASLFPILESISSEPRWRLPAGAQGSADFMCPLAYTHTPQRPPKLSLVVNNNKRYTYSVGTIASFNAKHISSYNLQTHRSEGDIYQFISINVAEP